MMNLNKFKINNRKKEEYLIGYTFLLPDFIGLVVFWIIPIFYSVYLSFFKYRLIGHNIFIGLQNYVNLFKDRLWWKSLALTGIYSLTFVPLVIVLSLFLALLVTKEFKFKNIFRTIYFLPYAVSMIAAGLAWSYVFDYKRGIINYLLNIIGQAPIDWLGSSILAFCSVTVVSIWKYMGFCMVIFIAGLEEIPTQYYEAASLDGAGSWQKFKYITIPLLKPVIFLISVLAFIRSFNVFDLIYVMTKGGPNFGTYMSTYHIYRKGFIDLQFGYASALTVVLLIITFSITIGLKKLYRE